MSANTATWNPLRGCSKVSAGCRNCYAEKMAARFCGPGQPYEGVIENGRWNGQIRLAPEVLDLPLRWRKPRRIFVNSMSDLFHENVSSNYILRVFEIMKQAHWHTFQVLTKRPERMLKMTQDPDVDWRLEIPPNVWLGVSVENQRAADERIPLLLQTPAAVRFLSMEPLLGSVDLSNINYDGMVMINCLTGLHGWPHPNAEQDKKIHWVIVGGESGPNARPMHPDWVRSIRDQCQAAGVPFFFKQWGEWAPTPKEGVHVVSCLADGFHYGPNPGVRLEMYRVGKQAAGRLLDGRTWDEYPAMAR